MPVTDEDEDNEEFYDDEVAPILGSLAEKCSARGMPFLACVGIRDKTSEEDDLWATTVMGAEGFDDEDGRMLLVRYAMYGSFENLAFAYMKHLKENGLEHSSIALKLMGLEPKPEDRT